MTLRFSAVPLAALLVFNHLFFYRLNAQTVFLLGYSDHHAGFDRIDLTQTDRTVFLKIGYALVL